MMTHFHRLKRAVVFRVREIWPTPKGGYCYGSCWRFGSTPLSLSFSAPFSAIASGASLFGIGGGWRMVSFAGLLAFAETGF